MEFNSQWMITSDGVKIRYAFSAAKVKKEQRIALVILQGRSSFIEKYSEVIQEAQNEGCDVWAFDWRGQGGSHRYIPDSQKIYIENYSFYLGDLHQFLDEKVKPNHSGPIVLLGSSMGAAILLRYLELYEKGVDGAVLLAPMFGLNTAPFPRFAVGPLVKMFNALGLGKNYVFGHGDFNPQKDVFETNSSTHDPARFLNQRTIMKRHPELLTSGVTWGWLKATLDELRELKKPENLKKIKTPVLVFRAGKDTSVDNRQDPWICEQIKTCTLRTFENSKHGIHVEVDSIRHEMWSNIRSFLSLLNQ